MIGLDLLFEEDIEMQDAIEDLEDLTDDTDDIIIGTMEDRNRQSEGDIHPSLFTNKIEESAIQDVDIEELLDDDLDDLTESFIHDAEMEDFLSRDIVNPLE